VGTPQICASARPWLQVELARLDRPRPGQTWEIVLPTPG
jgi:hypothetical protein